ncbi:hypothetical protein TNCV_4236401 [Trichonephila clavipes]|nr:hypothetical protein TNCV_4236401 [Trichonephila clavipes]
MAHYLPKILIASVPFKLSDTGNPVGWGKECSFDPFGMNNNKEVSPVQYYGYKLKYKLRAKKYSSISTYDNSNYANSEFHDFQISPIRFSFSFFIIETYAESVPELDEIGNLVEKVVDFAMQINSDVNSDDVQKLLDFHNHELTMDELVEMHEQEHNIELSVEPV